MHTGDLIENPRTGQRLVVRQLGDRTSPLLLEAVDPPGCPRSPRHVHPNQEESFEVLSGQLSVDLNGTLRRLSPGESITIPRGVPHAAWNAGAEPMRMLWESRPGLRTAEFFDGLYGLARRKHTQSAAAHLAHTIRLMRDFAPEVHVTWPPLPIQSLLFQTLAGAERFIPSLRLSTTRTH